MASAVCSTPTIGAVVMAAGSSTRFGSDKRLHREGASALLEKTLSHVVELQLPVQVMLRASDEGNAPALLGSFGHHENVTMRYVENPQRGLGHSIAQCFAAAPPWEGALLFLGDMPRIQPATARMLLQHFHAQRIQVPVCNNRRGHPVLFPRCYFSELARLQGDTGARQLLLREKARIDEHATGDAGVLWDLDIKP